MRRFVVAWAVLAGGTLLLSRPGLAQTPGRGYPKPIFSPYLDLFRADPGPLPNYYQFVRPKQELLKTLQHQNTELERQRAGLGAVQHQLSIIERQAQAGPTGIGAGFMNYSHYYPAQQSPALRVRRR
jgi:hypothetical protein